METTRFGVDYNIIYPVYRNMRGNYDVIHSMATEFWDKVCGELGGRSINLVFSGSSGAMIATIFYSVMRGVSDINLVNIRKKCEKSHETDLIGCRLDWDSAVSIFVDDHIFEGNTLIRCHRGVRKGFVFDYVVVSWVRAAAFNRIGGMVDRLFYTGLVP